MTPREVALKASSPRLLALYALGLAPWVIAGACIAWDRRAHLIDRAVRFLDVRRDGS